MLRLPIYEDYLPTQAAVEVQEPIDRDSLAELGAKGRACDRCALGVKYDDTDGTWMNPSKLRTPCLGAEGLPGGLLVLSEFPTRDEDTLGRPFVGSAGNTIRAMVKAHWDGPAAFDVALRCAPGRTKLSDKMINQCRPFLKQTIDEVRPTRIIALGNVAGTTLMGRSVTPFTTRGGYSYLRGYGAPIPVFFLNAPGPAIRNRFLRRWFEEDMKHALTAPDPPKGPWDAEATVVSTLKLALFAESELATQAWVSFDVETSGTMWNEDFEIISVALCGADDDEVWVWDRAALADPQMLAPLLRLLQNHKVPKGGQNVKYDQLAFRARYGIKVDPIIIDTRLQRKLIDPEADGALGKMAELVGMGGLKEEAQEHMSELVKAVKAAFRKKTIEKQNEAIEKLKLPEHVEAAIRLGVPVEKFMFALLPHETLTRYNARDALATKRLGVAMQEDIHKEPRLERMWRSHVLPAAVALERIEAWGVGCSKSAITQFDRYLEAREVTLKKTLDQYGDVNWDSRDQVADLLFNKLRLPALKATASGKASTDAETLEALADQTGHPLPKAMLDYRTVTKLRGTYAQGMFEHVRSDGRIHPNIKLDGARSGRTSCIRRGTPIEIVRDVSAQPLGVPVEDVKVGDLAYCYDDNGNLHIRPVVKTWARGKRKLVRVHWRSHGGRTGHLDLTPDHRLGKTDGSWCEAGKLVPGDRLFALGRRVRNGYAYVQPTASPELREHRFIFEEVFGWSPEAVHHKNENKIDNRVMNLEGMTKAVHHSHHGGENTPTHLREFRARKLKSQHEAGAIPRLAGERNGRWSPPSLEEATALLRAHAWSVKHAAKASGRDFQCFKDHLVRLGFDIEDLKRMNRVGRREAIVEGAAKARATRKANNHVVMRVEVLDEEDEVFDLMIEEHHNFIAGELRSKNCTDPNLQNIPRAQTDEGKMARDIFVAPPGKVLVELDYSQLELRVAAMLSQDDVMLEIFRSGVDYHLRTAQLVSKVAWGIDPDKVEDKHRSWAKNVNFGVLYGKTARSLAKEWGITIEKAERIVAAIMGNFKKLSKWCDARKAEAQKTGEVWTWWDGELARKRPLWRVADPDDYIASTARNGAINSPIQGTASDFCIASLYEAVQWIEEDGIEDDVKLVLPIHDALLFEVKESMVEEVVGTVTGIMVSHDSAGVPLVADCKVGKAWGSMEKYPAKKAA
jgi:uracil-DNA glycosylase family 4